MRDQAQQFGVGGIGFAAGIVCGQRPAVGVQGSAADVFQSAVDFVAQMQQKQVFGEGCRLLEQGDFISADGFDVGDEAFAVEIGIVPAQCDSVGDAVRFKMQHFDLCAHFKRMVDEFRVILRGKHAAALLGQGGLDVPCVRQVQRDFAGFVAAFGVGQKQACAVEKAAFVIQQAGTAGEVVGVNDIVDFPFAGRIGQPPGVFVDALHGGRLAIAGSLHLHNVA